MRPSTALSSMGVVVLLLHLASALWPDGVGGLTVAAAEESSEQATFGDPSGPTPARKPSDVGRHTAGVGVRAVFSVSSTDDSIDAAPGNGSCADTQGRCTLRAAIMEANVLAGAHTINLPAGTYTLTIPGGNENLGVSDDLDIRGSISIVGAGADSTIVDGNSISRVFDVRPPAVASISNLTIRNGRAVGNQGGGVLNQATLGLTNVKVLNNQAVSAGTTQGNGGGVENAQGGTLTISDSLISGNRAVAASGVGAFGGGIANFGINGSASAVTSQMTLVNTIVSDNTADSSGGGFTINQEGARVALQGSTVSGNVAGGGGGGGITMGGSGSSTLSLDASTVRGNTSTTGSGGGVAAIVSSTGTSTIAVTINRSTLDGNTSGTSSGGLAFGGPSSTLSITDSTFSNNRANGGNGGAMAFGNTTAGVSPGTATLINVTISGNTASGGGGGVASSVLATVRNTTVVNNTATGSGGGLSIRPGTMTLQNTIVAGNSGSPGADCNGTATSQGGNLISFGTCGLAGPGDLTNTNPLLGALANNGGPTLTHLPLVGSPAIDAGSNTGCPSTDQRGITRPLDGNGDGTAICDIGAVETRPRLPVVCTPRPPVGVNVVRTGDGRLRVTVTANGANNTIEQIQITRNANGTLTPATPPLGSADSQFFVSRTILGVPTTVALTITDRCGEWKTFVGGGTSGF